MNDKTETHKKFFEKKNAGVFNKRNIIKFH